MNNALDEHVLAERLLKSLIKRDFGEVVAESNLEHGLDQLTKIVGRMHGNNEVLIRNTFHEMVKGNKLYQGITEDEQQTVLYWMLCLTFGDGYDLEYEDEGIIHNTRG